MSIRLRRRDFIAALGGAAATWPLAVRAQRPPMPVIGFLHGGSPGDFWSIPFRQGLGEVGFVEGRNIAIEYRWLEGRYDRIPTMLDDLIRHQVAVIVIPNTTTSVIAAKAATQTIPIVFSIGSDPVEVGLVASLNQPGGNITGVSMLQTTVTGKRLELLHELVPAARSIAFLVNPTNPAFAEPETRAVQAAARVLGVQLVLLNASSAGEMDAAFATLVRERVGALLIGSDIFFLTHSEQLIALAARHAVPVIYAYLEQTPAGGLMSYGGHLAENLRLVGIYAGRILKGEKPADMPIQMITRVKLMINMKTARALGLTFPLTILGRADEVIE
jgi:putative ABC transport system substrate-binding protein